MNCPLRSLLGLAVAAASLRAQSADGSRTAELLSRWVGLTAPPGAEELATNTLLRALPGWTRDGSGNLVRHVGQGSPRRVVACGLDVNAYAVSEITTDGYIRLHRIGTPLQHALADQFMEARRVQIHTARGAVPGVVAIANGHFARQHRGDTAVVGVDQLWVDVGASSRAEVVLLGVSLLDPVTVTLHPWTFAGWVAGPGALARTGCAAVATAAQGRVARGETVFILSARRVMGWRGLTGALHRLGRVDSLFVVGVAPRDVASVAGAQAIGAHARYVGTQVESVQAAAAGTMLNATLAAAGATLPSDAGWVAPPLARAPARVPRTDIHEESERLLMSLLDIPGVPGHEWRVRNAVHNALPAWAQQVAVVDSAGNLIVAAGPERDSIAFVAHTDEVSFEVDRILGDGTVTLTPLGGVVLSAWEGQPAVLAFDPDASGNTASPLSGVFVPRDSAKVKAPTRLTAWFGLDSSALVARGVRPGSAVLGDKHATRLAGTRMTGRASDDRTGSTALLLAIRHVNPLTLKRKVLFVWTTREETGLFGARAFAVTYGTSLQRAYAVDTFVSSDTPLELPTFAWAPLGRGAVLRGLDDGSVTSRAERDRVIRAAKAAGIPLQLGTTHGSTDGSAIAAYGPADIGISWPGRYSHTPGEVLDLRDVDALARLIAALAVAR